VDKILSKHGVSPQEVEEVLRSDSLFRFVEKGRRRGEDVYAALGKTTGGRLLIVFFIRKVGGDALIISARDMDAKERRQYEKAKS
jgi:uncharacterized DUF497 family protein